jgi:hypothetical protein
MRVITDRPAYRPGTWIGFTVTNRTQAVLRYDWCSVSLASRGNGDDFPEARYSPARRCGFAADLQVVLDHVVPIQPGATLRDSVSVPGGANQSLYRVVVWLLDANGAPELGNPVVSNTVEVYPGASSAVSPR